jgi:homocysteine S-methyltransferase
MQESQQEFLHALKGEKLLLTEGAIVERVRRESGIPLDSEVAHAALIYSEVGRQTLLALWREYIDVARAHDTSILITTPTWRASAERLSRTTLPSVDQFSLDAVHLLRDLRAQYGEFSRRIFIGGLLGCRGDCYKPEEALNAEAAESFHEPQIQALARAGADCLLAATLPAFSEAFGMAKAMAAAQMPYVLSFVLRPSGTLLDGMPVDEAIARIDGAVSSPPSAYLANCMHPLHFEAALEAAERTHPGTKERLTGLQGNTSRKAPEEFDGAETLDSEEPIAFGVIMARIRARFGAHVLGGCCGTDARHIEAILRCCLEL